MATGVSVLKSIRDRFEVQPVVLLAINEWLFVILFVYCLNRSRSNRVLRVLALTAVLIASSGGTVAQRRLYLSENASRASVDRFDYFIVLEKAITIFVLFYSYRKIWHKTTVDSDESC